MLDPQLRNNHELVTLLVAFEEAWVLGTEHILDPRNREHVKVFSNLIQMLAHRYVAFKHKLDSCDA